MTNKTQQPYQQPQGSVPAQQRPVGQLKTNRSVGKYILLSIVTFGIYHFVFFYGIGDDMNVIASRHDGRRTMNFALVGLLLAPLTFWIMGFVWFHMISNRMASELARRGIYSQFSATTFWLWYVLGAFIVVGPWIYTHKMAKAMNLLAENYNLNG